MARRSLPRPGAMRVLYVINSLGTGGSERSLAELLGPLITLGVEPIVACLESPVDGVEPQVRSLGVPVHVVGAGRGPRALRGLLRQMTLTRPSLVHTTLFEADVLGRLAAAVARVPVVTSLVNSSYEPARLADPNVRRSRLEAARLVDGWTGRHLTTHFHAVSHAVKRSAERRLRLPPDRITVIERGRDPGRLGEPSPQRRKQARAAFGLQDQDEVVVTVGRQEYQKDQRCLIQAVAQLADRDRLVLLVAGRRGNASPGIDEALAGVPAGRRIRLLGHRDDVPELLAAADVFVLPSRYEGLPGALIEAMALGLPIVASDIPPVREVVEPAINAVLFPPGEAGALAGTIDKVLDDPAMRLAMGTASRSIFLERFTLDRSAHRLAGLYRQVLQLPTGSSPGPAA